MPDPVVETTLTSQDRTETRCGGIADVLPSLGYPARDLHLGSVVQRQVEKNVDEFRAAGPSGFLGGQQPSEIVVAGQLLEQRHDRPPQVPPLDTGRS
jgi:hypothetical protein